MVLYRAIMARYVKIKKQLSKILANNCGYCEFSAWLVIHYHF